MSGLELVARLIKRHQRVFGSQLCACDDPAPCDVHKLCDDFLTEHKRANTLEVKVNKARAIIGELSDDNESMENQIYELNMVIS